MPAPVRIILVDDHDLMRESWKSLLDKNDRFDIIAQCRNGADAIEQAKKLGPDVILMDINMSPINGFEATQKILEASPSIKIIGVSVNNSPKYAAKMLALGGRGFVTKTSAFAELTAAIEKVHDGEIYVCQEIKKKLPAEE